MTLLSEDQRREIARLAAQWKQARLLHGPHNLVACASVDCELKGIHFAIQSCLPVDRRQALSDELRALFEELIEDD